MSYHDLFPDDFSDEEENNSKSDSPSSLNDITNAVANTMARMQDDPEVLNGLFSSVLGGIQRGEHVNDIMDKVVNAEDSAFKELSDCVQNIDLSKVIDYVKTGNVKDAFDYITNLEEMKNSATIDQEVLNTVQELVKLPNKTTQL